MMNNVEKFIAGEIAVKFEKGDTGMLTAFQDAVGEIRFNGGPRADDVVIKGIIDKYVTYLYTGHNSIGENKIWFIHNYEFISNEKTIITVDEFFEKEIKDISENEIEEIFIGG